jgi:hypothetical protein
VGCRVTLVIFDLTSSGFEELRGTYICKEISVRSLRTCMQTKCFLLALVLLQFYGMIENGVIIRESRM